jgi:pilus assembly protein CpaC
MIRRFARSAAVAALALAPATAFAQAAIQSQGPMMAAEAAASSSVFRVDLSGGGSSPLSLPKGKSAIVELPIDARDVLVTNPAVAEAVLRTPRRIYVLGMTAGQTDAVFFDAAGRRILSLNIRVDQDTAALAQTINRVVPGARVKVDAMNDSVILSGQVMTATDADRAVQVARASVARPEQVLNMLAVAGKDQVMVKVRIVEMQRNVIKQLGFDTQAILNQLGEPQFLLGRGNTFGVNGGIMGGLLGGYKLDTTSQPIVNAYMNTPGGIWPSVPPFGDITNALSSSNRLTSLLSSSTEATNTLVADLTGLLANPALTAAQQTTLQQALAAATAAAGSNTGVPTATWSTIAGLLNTQGLNASVQAQINQTLNNAVSSALQNSNESLSDIMRSVTTNYNQAYDYTYSQNSTFRDRTNPAAQVATGRAGNAGLNQAQGLIQAFERVGLVRTLAEPNLTAVSGESAKFLAGGEFPVPVGQDDRGRVTIEFKSFGVGLGFTPVVMSGGRISLRISTEVSELTQEGSFSINNGVGLPSLNIPALNVRRAETTVELPSGGGMMIAGLLREQTRQAIDSIPGMTALPVLGTLFRSRDYLAGETELVVIVTPYIVSPTSPDKLQTPADGFKVANDVDTVLMGRLNKVYHAKPQPQPDRTYQGPHGYVIE